MHLGNPLSASLRLLPAVRIVTEELKVQLSELHTHPIQPLDRVLMVNTLVLPMLLYRTDCLPLAAAELREVTSLLERFALGVMGLPTLIATKPLYTHQSKGLGMGYFPVLNPTRLLDSLHRNPSLQAFSVRPRLPLAPFSLFQSAVALLGPAPTSTLSPVTVTWDAQRLQRDAKAVMSISGLVVYLLPPVSALIAHTQMVVVWVPRLPLVLLQSCPMALSRYAVSQAFPIRIKQSWLGYC